MSTLVCGGPQGLDALMRPCLDAMRKRLRFWNSHVQL